MRNAPINRLWMSALLLSALAAPAVAQQQQRYTDPINGFSLYPPAGGARLKPSSPSGLVTWAGVDPKTGDFIWSMTVSRHPFFPRGLFEDYAKDIDALLKKSTKSKTVTCKLTSTAPKRTAVSNLPAFEISGSQVERKPVGKPDAKNLPDLYFRQLWVKLPTPATATQPAKEPAVFLNISYTTRQPADMAAIWLNLTKGLKVFDPQKATEILASYSKRSEALLDAVDVKTLAAALPEKPEWFFIYDRNELIGWMCRQGKTAREGGRDGFEMRIWSFSQPKGKPIRFLRQRLFFTAAPLKKKIIVRDPKDKKNEKTMEKIILNPQSNGIWQTYFQSGQGEKAQITLEEGLRQGDIIVTKVEGSEKAPKPPIRIPADSVVPIYLPKVYASVLPALVDRTRTGGYVFAEFNVEKNDFEMRTFSVIGEDAVNVENRMTPAVKMTDLPRPGSVPSVVWADKKTGRLLQSEAPGGVKVIRSNYPAVKQQFPDMDKYVKAKLIRAKNDILEPREIKFRRRRPR